MSDRENTCTFVYCQVHNPLALENANVYRDAHTDKPRGMEGVKMDACQGCMGTGLDPSAPSRVTRDDAPQRATLTMVRPCTACDGRGVIAPAMDRDLMRPHYFARPPQSVTLRV